LSSASQTLVLGIGNTLLSDEGIGIHVLNQLKNSQHRYVLAASLVDGGTLSFTLAGMIEDCDRFIVIDAAELKDRPGTVRVFEDQAMDEFVTNGNKRSVHEVSLVDVLSITLLGDKLPSKRALVGIQPACVDWGEHPTGDVAAAVPVAVNEIESILDRWSHDA
jgi:hydrogenase maturation protease